METKNNTDVSDPDSQVTQQISAAQSKITQQIPITCPASNRKITCSMHRPIKPDPEFRVTQSLRRPIKSDPESQVIQSLHRQNLPARRPAPARSSLVQAFRQILAQQNDAEYITLSSGDEDEEYWYFYKAYLLLLFGTIKTWINIWNSIKLP
jgi:hypothetical protein